MYGVRYWQIECWLLSIRISLLCECEWCQIKYQNHNTLKAYSKWTQTFIAKWRRMRLLLIETMRLKYVNPIHQNTEKKIHQLFSKMYGHFLLVILNANRCYSQFYRFNSFYLGKIEREKNDHSINTIKCHFIGNEMIKKNRKICHNLITKIASFQTNWNGSHSSTFRSN